MSCKYPLFNKRFWISLGTASLGLITVSLIDLPQQSHALDQADLSQEPFRYTAIMPGTCEFEMMGEDLSELCAEALVHVAYFNGRIVFDFLTEDGVLSFRGLNDEQPQPEYYVLDLNQFVSTVPGYEQELIEVEGQCILEGNPMQDAVITCNAMGEDDLELSGQFTMTGQPQLIGPGQQRPEQPPQPL